jgi:hypothetical protein
MRHNRVIVATASVAFVVVLASTSNAQPQTQPLPLQQQPQRYEIALDSNEDNHPDDRDGDGTPDRWVDALFTCATSCGLYLSSAKACAVLGPVVYFCAGLAIYKCLRTCQTSIEHMDDQ